MVALFETYKFQKNLSSKNSIVLGEKPHQKYW
jgi:hypothetical protein